MDYDENLRSANNGQSAAKLPNEIISELWDKVQRL